MLNRRVIGAILAMSWLVVTAAWADDDKNTIQIAARYEIEPGTRVGRLVIACDIPRGMHIYSLLQSSPPGPTKIRVADSDDFKLTSDFTTGQSPNVIERDPVFDTRIEQFFNHVEFSAPLQISENADLERLEFDLKISCQVCSDDGCILVRNKKVDVRFGGYVDPAADEKKPSDSQPGRAPGGKDD